MPYYYALMEGSYISDLDDTLKERFLGFVASGYTRPEAAGAIGTTARVVRAYCSPRSHRYDPAFAEAYADLTKKDGEHELALNERLRTASIHRALNGSDRLLEKELMIRDPDWHIHRPQALQVTNVNIEELRTLVPSMPEETLRQIVADHEAKKKQIEPPRLLPDIDAA